MSEAALGKLPLGEDVVDLQGLRDFCSTLEKDGAVFAPSLDTLTTVKRRMPFQGQPKKTRELTVAHKDFVVLPRAPPLGDGLHFNIAQTVIGGQDKPGARNNVDLLQPSANWPCDHCAILCVLEVEGAALAGDGESTTDDG